MAQRYAQRQAPEGRPQARSPEDERRLAEAWSHEFLHVAMMSAFVAMGCNTLALRRSPAGMAAIEGNIPDEPAIHRAIRQGLLDLPTGHDPLLTSVERAYAAMDRAIREFRAVQYAPAEQLTPEELDRLAAYWREAIELLLVALEHFATRNLVRPAEPSPTTIQERCPRRIRSLLSDAISGDIVNSESRSLSQGGPLHHRLQRRRWNRKDLDLPCRVESRGASLSATVRNISLGGALLSGVPFLIRGTPVCVTLECGRSLDATVMWARDDKAGIKFASQLMFNDPLIAEPPEESGRAEI